MVTIIRNGMVHLEELQVILDNRLYRVTGTPTVREDKYAMVEVLRPETMHGHKDRVRFAHWARITSAKRRDEVREASLRARKGE